MTSNSTFQTPVSPVDSSKNAGNTEDSKPAAITQEPQGTRRLPAVLGMRDLTVFLVLTILATSFNCRRMDWQRGAAYARLAQ